MNAKTLFILATLAIVAIVASKSLYVVNETQRAVLLKFGEVVESDLQPGLHAKVPLMHQVKIFDARVLTLDSRAAKFLTVEKKAVEVDSFAKWRIVDVSRFYTSTNGDEIRAQRLLEQRINEGLRNEFAQRSLQEVVSGERAELMTNLTEQLNGFTKESLGVEVVDVRVKKIDLPNTVSGPIFSRMAAERQREAQEHRAKGGEQAAIIRADAERQKTILEAQAYKESELLRGEGDAKAAAIYASAYDKDPEFYAFVRSLTAYRSTFSGKQDVLVLSPESEFFEYFNSTNKKK
ncbi:protease modulator HflC [Saccharophagus degradans]|uniref:protease modulator HflC n=1 Tax=Saccharophagus degradans TaxID=86304 RepID=UPI001C09B999|nr:protease modulator HflC [Saccharophagus degradans]MBU2987705.1 protease modulator HflC [Saccharophagus degradans]